MSAEGFIPPHGNYRELFSYQKAEVVYDITFRFCHKFLKKGDRTVDQMIQAARSGKQNISEGSEASGTSKETEIKLTSVARSSLGELLLDYKDFLRVRDFPLWDKNSKEVRYVRRLGNKPHVTYETFREFVENPSARGHRQYRHLLDPPGQLLARPANQAHGAGFSETRRTARAHDPRTPPNSPKWQTPVTCPSSSP